LNKNINNLNNLNKFLDFSFFQKLKFFLFLRKLDITELLDIAGYKVCKPTNFVLEKDYKMGKRKKM
jgi:hypothetical protein